MSQHVNVEKKMIWDYVSLVTNQEVLLCHGPRNTCGIRLMATGEHGSRDMSEQLSKQH